LRGVGYFYSGDLAAKSTFKEGFSEHPRRFSIIRTFSDVKQLDLHLILT
jgi:hypothetical protein